MSPCTQEGLSESPNLAQEKPYMQYFKAYQPPVRGLSSPQPHRSQPAQSHPHNGEKKPFSRHFGFPGTKNIVQLPFFSSEKQLTFGFVHESGQGQSNGHLSWSASLASSSGTRPEEPVHGSVLLHDLLRLCFLPTAPPEKDTA